MARIRKSDGTVVEAPDQDIWGPPPTWEQIRAAKFAELADLRWAREVGGISLPDGTPIRTDRTTQAALTSAMASVQAGTITETDWKLESGWITLRGPQIVAIAGAVARHVKACFRAERVVYEAVDEVVDVSAAFDTAYAAAMAVAD